MKGSFGRLRIGEREEARERSNPRVTGPLHRPLSLPRARALGAGAQVNRTC